MLGTPRAALVAPLIAAVIAIAALVVAPVAGAATASDPRASEVWALDGDGPMGITSAWDHTVGGEVVVAVLDTGVDLRHPDLVENLWVNPREIPGNGRDDDGNGVVDDVHGADVVNGDGDPSDDNGHGTHVAGILGARGGNGIGAAGVAWRVRLMSVKVLDAGAGGDTGGVAAGIDYAVAHGARILNLSLAAAAPSGVLDDAIARAEAAGVLVVAAAGNSGADLTARPAWPAVSDRTNVLSVTASAASGLLSSVGAFGSPVDLAAPGEAILATARGGGYEWRTGTSMAAPMAAGAAALVAAASGHQDARVLRAALVDGARRGLLPVGAGALDVAGALRRVGSVPAPSATPTPPAGAPATRAKSKTTKAKVSCTSAARRAAKKAAAKKAAAKRAAARRAAAKRAAARKARARTTSWAAGATRTTSSKTKKKTSSSSSSKKAKKTTTSSCAKRATAKNKKPTATRSRTRSGQDVVPVRAAA